MRETSLVLVVGVVIGVAVGMMLTATFLTPMATPPPREPREGTPALIPVFDYGNLTPLLVDVYQSPTPAPPPFDAQRATYAAVRLTAVAPPTWPVCREEEDRPCEWATITPIPPAIATALPHCDTPIPEEHCQP